ncbi:thiolase C-terminal domain-containing protein [Mycolicibacterium thermoresistibile]|uniref:Lipid-transfer protein n=2 Tax=Mycolicibacterium thermoresistibile TaxID=1797 RepID=G7CH37_MYCT3|nr:hypothetical protein [Mycolicibacterium thermoresistibile]EHI12147.1 lipid-transfer protein [Mycolicibacterium thermoresistibile ATCC 19527]MCV7191138.1 lipid-transfer protein [Mycolicibacterium thermoresistibile]GAT15514.1 lipid-transfer protein [Mycolicibacterium thermoresistibile]SNW16935.1 lipid-transfer protein [Mycolicibacterium thermoresistibile]
MEFNHRDACAIVGIGTTEFSKNSGRSVVRLATEAIAAAIADAGLRPCDIDGVVRCDYDDVLPNDLAEVMGLPLTYWSTVGIGGAAPSAMVGQAVAAILSGQATNVVVYRSLNGRSGRRLGSADQGGPAPAVGGHGSYDEFFLPYGLNTPGQVWAIIAQRHMIEFGTKPADLGAIALTCRANANNNPNAQMRDRTLSMAEYEASPMISAPLRLYDYCLETDGACAVVVTAADRAADLAQQPVLIRAVAQGAPERPQPGLIYPVLLREKLTTQPSAWAARTLYRRAGLGPDDIDVAQLYDCFTITVLMQLEDYGFCAKGEGGAFAAGGAIGPGGRLPINTAGGNLSEGYIHGMNHVVEGVRQMRGTSPNQVEGAEVCLVTSGIPVSTSAMILRRP